MKRCTRCGELKARGEFNRRKVGRDGLNAQCRACWAAYQKAWRDTNPDHQGRARKRNGRISKARNNDRARRWKAAHPEWRRADRARRRGEPMPKEAEPYLRLLLVDPCSYCGLPADTVDHIEPLQGGGDSSSANLTAACRSCNASKSDTPLLIWLARRGVKDGSSNGHPEGAAVGRRDGS